MEVLKFGVLLQLRSKSFAALGFAAILLVVAFFVFSLIFAAPAVVSDAYVDNSPLSANALTPLGGRTLQPGDASRLVVMGVAGDPDGSFYQAFDATNAGLTAALEALYERNCPNTTYIMYVGANLTAIPTATFGTGATGTFASLQGRINGLVITGTEADPVNTNVLTAAAQAPRRFERTGAAAFTANFGTHIHLRNIAHDFGTIVQMHGHDLTLGGSTWQASATEYRGGAATGTVVAVNGTVRLTVHSTGSGTSEFIGGMAAGTLQGNTAILITGTSGNTIDIYGGGFGTADTVAGRAHVTGSVSTTITGMATGSGGLSRVWGGARFGTVGESISTQISGPGRWAASDTAVYPTTPNTGGFTGGFTSGHVGAPGTVASDLDTSDFVNDYSPILTSDDFAIRNYLDMSNFTNGTIRFVGGNFVSGVIRGDIINVVHANTSGNGSLSEFSGGGSRPTRLQGTWRANFNTNSANGVVTNVEAARLAAENRALDGRFAVYGNITNIVRAGSISTQASGHSFWFRGAGWGGYIEGDIYSLLGTEGLVYNGTRTGYWTGIATGVGAPAGRLNALNTGFDIVGAGGCILFGGTYNNCQLIVGNVHLIQYYTHARWTYGGGFGGCVIGNTKNELHRGTVDTLEGGGYIKEVLVGDTRAEVHGGQIEWFLTGGGWGDRWHHGNASVEVFDAEPRHNIAGAAYPIINASMGGMYGFDAAPRMSGNSDMMIRGGDFRGVPRTGPRGFSAGPTNNGQIFGDATLTMDLRGNQHGFRTNAQNPVIAGLTSGSAGNLGFDRNNTITLNIFTDPGSDLLAGMNLYGDQGGTSTRSGYITMNINAPDSHIGSVFATSYANLTGTGTGTTATSRRLMRDVEINLVSAYTIEGLSAGNGFSGTGAAGTDATNTLTNVRAAASAADNRAAVINVGPQSNDPNHPLACWEDATADGRPPRINVGGTGATAGINGFTEMNIKGRIIASDTGAIRNGGARVSSFANYDAAHNAFGDVTLYAGHGVDASGFGARTAGDFRIAAGALNVVGDGHVYIQSQGTINQAIFNNAIIDSGAIMTWLRSGSAAQSTFSPLTCWFGASSGFHVFTVRHVDRTRVEAVTPFNLEGIDDATGRTFLGDTVIPTTGSNGYAVCIPGSIFTWQVTQGQGMISHDVDVYTGTSRPAAGTFLNAIGTVPANTPSTSGRIAIPSHNIPTPIAEPTFSFIPSAALGEWVHGIQIHRSDWRVTTPVHASCTYVTEHDLRDYMNDYLASTLSRIFNWTAARADDRYFGFDITAQFTNETQLEARSVIITESEAAALIDFRCVVIFNEAAGRPFFTHTITDAVLDAIRAPLPVGDVIRTHPITYGAGAVSTPAHQELTVNVVVVRDGSVLAPDRSFGVFAQDATMELEIAQSITRAELDADHTLALAFTSEGNTYTPDIAPAGVIADINATTDAQVPRDVPVSYSFVPAGSEAAPVSVAVVVTVIEDFIMIPTGLYLVGGTAFVMLVFITALIIAAVFAVSKRKEIENLPLM